MLGWLFGKLKTLFLIAALGGPALAGFMWWDEQRIKEVETKGLEATATIDGATRTKRRRSGESYDVNLSWKDQKGQPRTAAAVGVSRAFASQIIRDDRIVRDTVKIKYMADDLDAKPILLEDVGRQAETDRELMWVGAGAGVVGLAGSLLFLLVGRRRQTGEAA